MYYSSGSGSFGHVASGAGGGNQSVEVTLSPGTYGITIGAAGIASQSTAASTDGGSTTAFGHTSTGGGRAYIDSNGSTVMAGTGGMPNGGNGSVLRNISIDAVNLVGGAPNGGAITNGVAQNGGDGYMEITFA